MKEPIEVLDLIFSLCKVKRLCLIQNMFTSQTIQLEIPDRSATGKKLHGLTSSKNETRAKAGGSEVRGQGRRCHSAPVTALFHIKTQTAPKNKD